VVSSEWSEGIRDLGFWWVLVSNALRAEIQDKEWIPFRLGSRALGILVP